MSTGNRIPFSQAQEIAEALVGLVRPYCKRIEVCGSLRRRKPVVGDVDLVCQPEVVEQRDLFGNLITEHWPLDDACRELLDRGALRQRLDTNGRACWGRHLKRGVFRGLAFDLRVCTDPDSWGTWIAISTGPAEFNRRLVTPRASGGLLPDGMQFRDGFRLYRGLERLPVPDEKALFEALGLDYLPPERRSAHIVSIRQ